MLLRLALRDRRGVWAAPAADGYPRWHWNFGENIFFDRFGPREVVLHRRHVDRRAGEPGIPLTPWRAHGARAQEAPGNAERGKEEILPTVTAV